MNRVTSFVFPLTLFVLLLFPGFAQASELTAETAVRTLSAEKVKLIKAYELINKKNYDEALPLLKQVLKSDSANVEAHRYLAHCYLHKGLVSLSLSESKQVEELGTELPHDMFALAEALFYNGKTKEALKFYKEALVLNPLFIEARMGFIRGLMALGKVQQAKKICYDAAYKSPGSKAKYQFKRLYDELNNKTQLAGTICGS